MEFIVANWKLILIAILAATTALMFKLWQGEVRDFAEFKGAIVVLGQEAEKFAKAENDKHEKALKESNDEWSKQLPGIRTTAIDNYMRRFPRGLCAGGGGQVPGPSNNPEGANGAVEERVASDTAASGSTGSAAQDAFVAACGEDAGKLKLLRSWVSKTSIKVEQ